MITDHKPVVPLRNSDVLDDVPIHCKRVLMPLMRFNLETEYEPWKTLFMVDALSRSPQSDMMHNKDSHSDSECYVAAGMSSMPVYKAGGLIHTL